MQYRNGRQGMVTSLQPTNAKLHILLHPDLGLRDPLQSRLATLYVSGGVNEVPWAVVELTLTFKKPISVLKTQCKEAHNLIWVVAHLKWGGDRDTFLMLYWAIVRSKLDYGCIVYGTASNTDLQQLDSIHNSGLRLALGTFCTSWGDSHQSGAELLPTHGPSPSWHSCLLWLNILFAGNWG